MFTKRLMGANSFELHRCGYEFDYKSILEDYIESDIENAKFATGEIQNCTPYRNFVKAIKKNIEAILNANRYLANQKFSLVMALIVSQVAMIVIGAYFLLSVVIPQLSCDSKNETTNIIPTEIN